MHIPNSTYRLQFNSNFNFNSAKEIIGYLSKLGISDVYASPVFKAKKGSSHGYDIVEPNLLNPEMGSNDEFEALMNEVKENQMGWLQDFVPNHMAYNYENRMLVDLLENGENSRYRDFFDIDWNHHHAGMKNRVLAPFLGKYYQESLENGEIKLIYDNDGLSINYYETRLPLKIESYSDVLSFRLDKLRNALGRNDPVFIRYMGILFVIKSLASAEELDERYNQIKFIKGILWDLYNDNARMKDFISENLKILNGIKGKSETYDQLDNLLSQQNYRIAFWKVANEEINYRRFFNVNELISLKIENESVFSRIHTLVFKFIKEGKITGLRIDHIDGLYDPAEYLKALRERNSKLFIVVEKILELKENLPGFWPIQGTTGYDFLNYLNGIFCARKNGNRFSSFYNKFTGLTDSYEQIITEKKRLIVETRMAGDVENLAILIEDISSKDRIGVDITLHGVKEALEEILVHFPIYRTYISNNKKRRSDREYLTGVINKVKEKNPLLATEFNYIGSLLTRDYTEQFTAEQKRKTLAFIMKFQQLTGPIMAKGFEDTSLYVYNRLVSLNEVGSDPQNFGIAINEFYNFCRKRSQNWPHTQNTTSTHDTKRGEDVRARINVLSEIPEIWIRKVRYWNRINRNLKKHKFGHPIPDNNLEYFIYQILVGSYPFNNKQNFTERIKQYFSKAMREAKEHSSWVNPDMEYESGVFNFIENILDEKTEFFRDFHEFKNMVSFYGVFNSLSQVLIKAASPGIPDFYQGSELWDLFLVDPDNRQPVDFKTRNEYLNEIIEKEKEGDYSFLKEWMLNPADGRIKMYLTHKTLQFRKNNMDLFNEGEFIPLQTGGMHKSSIICFSRKTDEKHVIIIAPRFLIGVVEENQLPLGHDIWQDTFIDLSSIGNESIKNELTNENIEAKDKALIGDIFKTIPYSLLKVDS